MMPRILKSFCRNCGAAGRIGLQREGLRIFSLKGDRYNPISRSYICIKGDASRQLYNSESRLANSLKRSE
jgi:anaerobic selenocysteine-containing dehydrogenase